jgi:hypothetical protein
MSDDDQRFEEFLRGFELRRPRPLPGIVDARHRKWWLPAAVAALALIGTGGAMWIEIADRISKRVAERPSGIDRSFSRITSAPSVSSIALTQAALDDGKYFETEMDELARSTLPSFDRPDSSLRGLAKE